MKYRKKDIGPILADKNWEGVKRFTDKFGMAKLLLLERIVQEQDWEGLKKYVQEHSLEPVLEYGLPVEGEGIQELHELDRRYHASKRKIGAEWWLRDEIDAAVRQLQGWATDEGVQERTAMAWKEVDAALNMDRRAKENAFRKVLLISLMGAVFRPESEEEDRTMGAIYRMFSQLGFRSGIGYRDDYED